MEGDAALGARYAVQVSMAYKGSWVRETTSMAKDKPASWKEAEQWFAAAVAGLHETAGGKLSPGAKQAPGKLLGWTLEACTGLQPLVVVMAQDMPATTVLPAGSVAVLSVQLELADGPWHCAASVRMGGASTPTTLLGD